MNLETRIKKVLRLAGKSLGQRRKGHKLIPLETAIHAVLAPGNADDVSRKALQQLLRAFVDWNEVRVSSWKEIGTVLEKTGVVDSGHKALALRNLLRAVFHRINKMSLDPLLQLKDEDARRKLENMPDFPETAIGAVLTLNLGMDGLYVTHPLLRIARRIGIVRDISLSRGRKDLERKVQRKDHFRFQQHLSHLASTVCLASVTRCEECPLNKICRTGVEFLVAAEARRREALEAAKKKGAKKARKKPPPKAKLKAKARAKPKAKSRAKPKAKARAKPKTKAKSKSKAKPRKKAKPKAKAAARSRTRAKTARAKGSRKRTVTRAGKRKGRSAKKKR
ncbi:MAG: hypothetical protein ACYS47_05235 [Planctomycetota bacterium]